MRHVLSALALVAFAATAAGAQQTSHAGHAMRSDSAHHMKTPCPLHLETLSLTVQQTSAVDSLRADHATIMKSVMRSHEGMASHGAMKHSAADKAVMESGMRLTTAAMRSILTDTQRATFNAAVTAHGTEMAAMKARGDHDCMACCKECMAHMRHPAAARKDP